jgi:uncharacterized protein with FMN-binding domain
MAAAHLHRGFVALSASAVAAVYLAGYVQTQSADAGIGVAAGPAIVAERTAAPTAVAPAVAPVVLPRSATAALSSATAAPSATPAVVAQGVYKDGTYTGQGSSRRGGVAVNVVVQNGRIASVTIANSTLQYPVRDIAGLPAQVVQRQSAQVDTVSRATYSSQAFRGAVAAALAKAA